MRHIYDDENEDKKNIRSNEESDIKQQEKENEWRQDNDNEGQEDEKQQPLTSSSFSSQQSQQSLGTSFISSS